MDHFDKGSDLPHLLHQAKFVGTDLQHASFIDVAIANTTAAAVGPKGAAAAVGGGTAAVVRDEVMRIGVIVTYSRQWFPMISQGLSQKVGETVVSKGVLVRASRVTRSIIRSTEMPGFVFHGYGPIARTSDHQ